LLNCGQNKFSCNTGIDGNYVVIDRNLFQNFWVEAKRKKKNMLFLIYFYDAFVSFFLLYILSFSTIWSMIMLNLKELLSVNNVILELLLFRRTCYMGDWSNTWATYALRRSRRSNHLDCIWLFLFWGVSIIKLLCL